MKNKSFPADNEFEIAVIGLLVLAVIVVVPVAMLGWQAIKLLIA